MGMDLEVTYTPGSRADFLASALHPSKKHQCKPPQDSLLSDSKLGPPLVIVLYPSGFTFGGSLYPYDSTSRSVLRSIDLAKIPVDLLNLHALVDPYIRDGCLPVKVVDKRYVDFPATESEFVLRPDSATIALEVDQMPVPDSIKLAIEQKLLVKLLSVNVPFRSFSLILHRMPSNPPPASTPPPPCH